MASSVATVARCPHGSGTVSGSPRRVTAGGAPLLTAADAAIAGCLAPPADRCARVRWLNADDRVLNGGQAVIFVDTIGLCLTAADIPTGTAIVTGSARVSG
jgi:hypothetical protein